MEQINFNRVFRFYMTLRLFAQNPWDFPTYFVTTLNISTWRYYTTWRYYPRISYEILRTDLWLFQKQLKHKPLYKQESISEKRCYKTHIMESVFSEFVPQILQLLSENASMCERYIDNLLINIRNIAKKRDLDFAGILFWVQLLSSHGYILVWFK